MISYDSPSYSYVREKFEANVKYSNDKIRKNKTRKRLFIGIEPNINFDPNKYMDKYNNHTSTKAPDLSLMSSRFSKNYKNILPCYMQKMFQRGCDQNINEKTLELNSYSNRGLRSSESYFFPKRSYNNIINLNLINASVFQNKLKNDEVKEKIDIIKNEISFNHKGYEELIKEGALKRFDGVTYKSYKRNIKNNEHLFYRTNSLSLYQ